MTSKQKHLGLATAEIGPELAVRVHWRYEPEPVPKVLPQFRFWFNPVWSGFDQIQWSNFFLMKKKSSFGSGLNQPVPGFKSTTVLNDSGSAKF